MEWLFFGLLLLGLVGVYLSVISFPLFLLLLIVLTGGIWLIDALFFKKKRLATTGEPAIVDLAKSFFPIILLVFTLRSFVVEPFKIPSGSMMPTLLTGDYILVNKFTYGLRVPILNNTFFEINQPKRGDVFVFHYPPEPKLDYIKRVIGLPGDKIQYQDKRLIINGKVLDVKFEADYEYEMQGENIISARRSTEQLGDVAHNILIHDVPNQYNDDAPGAKLQAGETITVPDGHYFAMGDNRDNSADSRVWGFVPEKNLVGKAFFIWMNFGKFGRIGTSIK
jgi:signal peptidase I